MRNPGYLTNLLIWPTKFIFTAVISHYFINNLYHDLLKLLTQYQQLSTGRLNFRLLLSLSRQSIYQCLTLLWLPAILGYLATQNYQSNANRFISLICNPMQMILWAGSWSWAVSSLFSLSLLGMIAISGSISLLILPVLLINLCIYLAGYLRSIRTAELKESITAKLEPNSPKVTVKRRLSFSGVASVAEIEQQLQKLKTDVTQSEPPKVYLASVPDQTNYYPFDYTLPLPLPLPKFSFS